MLRDLYHARSDLHTPRETSTRGGEVAPPARDDEREAHQHEEKRCVPRPLRHEINRARRERRPDCACTLRLLTPHLRAQIGVVRRPLCTLAASLEAPLRATLGGTFWAQR